MQFTRRRYAIAVAILVAGCSPDSKAPTDPGGPPLGNLRNWSDPATWPSGQVPAVGDSVVIPAGTSVRLDLSPPALHSLTIHGDLVLGDNDISLTTGWIVVTGTLVAGSPASPYTHRALITLTGTPGDADILSMGNKMIGVLGRLELHGEARRGWTHLTQTASAGATTLHLEQSPGWRAGDRIVLASSDYNQGQAEEAIIASASGTTVTLSQGLRHEHFGQILTVSGVAVDERAEVGLLSRNITIQGDTGATPGYGGHIIVMGGATAHVEGVELYHMGQRAKLARYPMHWHMAGDVTGQYFRNSSVWRTFSRCVTVHGSDNATVKDNVCYDHAGHGYFLEDGAETGNLIEGNLGLTSHDPGAGVRLLPSDESPATFWCTNPANTVRGNVAAGSEGFGFWYALPAAPTGLSTGAPDRPQTTPLGSFTGNVAHSNHQGGLFVDNGPLPSGQVDVTVYRPHADPNDQNSPPVVADFADFRAYKHYYRAVWLRGDHLRLSNAILADNAIGATFAAYETFVEHSVFIGQTGSLPALPSTYQLRGYEFYDGRVGAHDVTFINYTAATTVPASGIGYLLDDAFSIDPLNEAGTLTFVNARRVYLKAPNPDKDGDKAAVFYDRDGAVSGAPGRWVVSNTPLLVTPPCTFQSDWNAHICPTRYARLSFNSASGEAVAPLTVVRDDAVSQAFAGGGNQPNNVSLSVIPARGYTLQWGAATPTHPNVYLSSAQPGDAIRVSFPFAAAPSKVIRDYDSAHPLTAAGSLAQLDASSGTQFFFDAATATLHLKFVVQAARDWATLFVQP
jgi:cell migration-inducing and hyaluronan-binding protein